MSKNLSQKALREVFKATDEPLNIEGVMNALDDADVVYNSDMLKGTLSVMVEKGLIIQPKRGNWARKPTGAGGGRSLTHMYKVNKPLDPVNASIDELPYDKEAIASDPLLATTRRAAVRKAKAAWFHEDYSPKLAAYRELEDSTKPSSDED